jgi:hypothetical protein
MARSMEPHQIIRTLAVIFMVLIGVVGLAALLGPNWVGNYVVTAVVVIGVVSVSVSVSVWVVKRLPYPPFRDGQQ